MTTPLASGCNVDEFLGDPAQPPYVKVLHQRTNRRPRPKGSQVDDDSDALLAEFDSSESDVCESSGHASYEWHGPLDAPRGGHPFTFGGTGEEKGRSTALEELGVITTEGMRLAPTLPVHAREGRVESVPAYVAFFEACVDQIAPYYELSKADTEQNYDKVKEVSARLLVEWYVVGALVSVARRLCAYPTVH